MLDGPHVLEDNANVARNTLLALLTQVVTAALTAFLTLYLTRTLGPRRFGEFALAVGIVGVLVIPSDLGISQSIGRFVAEHRGDRGRASAFFADAHALKFAVTAALSIVFFAVAGPLASAYGDHHLAWPFRGMAIVLFGQSMMLLYTTALVSVGRIAAMLAAYTSEGLAETIASVTLVALGAGATGASFGRAAGYVVGAGTALVLVARAFGRDALTPRRPEPGRAGQIIRYAGVLFIVNGAYTLFSQVDILVLGAIKSSREVALFAAPMRLCNLLHYPGLAVSNSVSPRLARSETSAPDVASFEISLRWLVILQAATVAPVLVWAGPIIHLLLGHGYAGSAPVLRALAPYVFLQGIGPLVSVGLNYLGESRRRVPIAISAFVIDLILDLILIPHIGALGGAIATSVAYGVYVPTHLLICARVLGLDLRPMLMTVARALVAAAAAAAVLALAGTSHLTVLGWLGGGTGAIVVFIGALLATREVSAAEFLGLARMVGGRLGLAARGQR